MDEAAEIATDQDTYDRYEAIYRFRGWNGAPDRAVWYGTPLAERLRRLEIMEAADDRKRERDQAWGAW